MSPKPIITTKAKMVPTPAAVVHVHKARLAAMSFRQVSFVPVVHVHKARLAAMSFRQVTFVPAVHVHKARLAAVSFRQVRFKHLNM
jgi:hypothetical protein